MRSKNPDLEEVLEQFEAWRAKPHGRLIPDELWKGAVSLLDRYSPSTICSRLRLNATRFKRVREASSAKANGTLARRRRGQAEEQSVRLGRRTLPGQMTRFSAGRNAFLELPPPGVARGMMYPTLREHEPVSTGCRLTVESAFGTLNVVTSRSSEDGLVEAVCRFVLGALADSSRT